MIDLNGKIGSMYFGQSKIDKAYLGTDLIYQAEAPGPSIPYICFTAREASTVMLYKKGAGAGELEGTIEYSADGFEWSSYTPGTSVSLASREKVYFRGKGNTKFRISSTAVYKFSGTGLMDCSGELYTLLDYEDPDVVFSTYAFYQFFEDFAALATPPAHTFSCPLRDYCFAYMYHECSNLERCPDLYFASAKSNCYAYMFYDCTSLSATCDLPLVSLATQCCQHMFEGCTGITKPCELLAISLSTNCYTSMFSGCTSIKLSETQTAVYKTPYRIPVAGEGTALSTNTMNSMFANTGGTFVGKPELNKTYYLAD